MLGREAGRTAALEGGCMVDFVSEGAGNHTSNDARTLLTMGYSDGND